MFAVGESSTALASLFASSRAFALGSGPAVEFGDRHAFNIDVSRPEEGRSACVLFVCELCKCVLLSPSPDNVLSLRWVQAMELKYKKEKRSGDGAVAVEELLQNGSFNRSAHSVDPGLSSG